MLSTPPGAQQRHGVGATRACSHYYSSIVRLGEGAASRSFRPAQRTLTGRKEGTAASGSSGTALWPQEPQSALAAAVGTWQPSPMSPSPLPCLQVLSTLHMLPWSPLTGQCPLPFPRFIGSQGPGRTAILGEPSGAPPATASSPRPSAGSERHMLGRDMHCPAL